MFSIIENIKKRKIIGFFNSVEDFVLHIKNHEREDVSKILELRKLSKGTDEYKNLKSTFPVVTYNFTFNKSYVHSKNVDTPTGYLYFDIDGETEFDYDVTYVTAIWKSIGGNGLGILIKVNNLEKEYFKQCYEYIGKDILQIPYDTACNDLSRLNFISFDEEIYFNEQAETIDLLDFIDSIRSHKEKHPHYSNNNKLKLGYEENGGKIRFNNLSEVVSKLDFEFVNGEYHYFDPKINYCECFYPKKTIREGARNKYLSSFAYCLISLNPNAIYTSFKHHIDKYNNEHCNPLMEESEINELTDKIYNLRGKVEPRNNMERRYIFNPNLELTRKRKQQIIGHRNAQERIKKTIKEIAFCMKNWDYNKNGKMTYKNVTLITGKNRKTIDKHYRAAKNLANIITLK